MPRIFPHLRKGRGAQYIELNDTPLPVTASHTHNPKDLVCYYFKESNSMRHLRALNLKCSHRINLRLFHSQRRTISHIGKDGCVEKDDLSDSDLLQMTPLHN